MARPKTSRASHRHASNNLSRTFPNCPCNKPPIWAQIHRSVLAALRYVSVPPGCNPQPAAGEANFHRVVERPKSCEIEGSRGELVTYERDTQSSRQQRTSCASLTIFTSNILSPRSAIPRRRKFFGRMTLARSCAERACATTRTKNVIPSADRRCSSSSPSRWTPRRPPSPSALRRDHLRGDRDREGSRCHGVVWDRKKGRSTRYPVKRSKCSAAACPVSRSRVTASAA